jgi:hypothetical protein
MSYDAEKVLGTTFSDRPLFSDLPQRGRNSDASGLNRLMGVTHQLTAQHVPMALEHGLDFLEVVQAAHDLGPFPLRFQG